MLALTGLWRAFHENNSHVLRFVATLLCFPAVYYVSHPEAYYLRPIDPLIAILRHLCSSPAASGLKNAGIYGLLTALAMLVEGYHPGLEDDSFYSSPPSAA